jgi:hexosaminidase
MMIRKMLLCCLFVGHLAAQERPALIPMPASVIWKSGQLVLSDRLTLKLADSSVADELRFFKDALNEKGKRLNFSSRDESISFEISLDNALSAEAYHLTVASGMIRLTGGTDHGIFNGIQTLLQLMGKDYSLPFVEIKDKPAFSIRGFMIDVGRNFQSIPLIKDQIDMMAKLKMNVFHFHLTEDIAWRIESKRYPALNDSIHMIRNKGKFYRFDEIRELVAYCRERHIELIPEIDMPGHSAAFARAIGYDMQSPEGKKILVELLHEFMDEINVKYIHIGGDEVRYKDSSFLKDMSQLLLSRGKKILAWDPGGKTLPGTIHQLWQGNVQPPVSQPSIDSRHLYLNHLDPLEGVPSTFNHRILNVDKGDSLRLGAILCNWPDRKVADERDAIIMNPVLPVMMAFAERTWRGGGYYNYGAEFGKPGDIRYQDFQHFENRMIRLYHQAFVNNEFPYVAQSNVSWVLIGPFDNKGDLNRSFAPEQPSFFDTAQLDRWNKVFGATIWLRHFWHPMINSHIRDPKDSTTWYAYREIYSDQERTAPFWIGFKNISRSVQAATPPAGQWDERGSKVWVNDELIEPPLWKLPGRVPSSLEEPLVDESYEYRQPTRIRLKKGLNRVLIKVPAGNFKGPWYDPIKWMFTFVESPN